ncbi:MAG: response regulator [Elusimicrobiota bacterium]
MKKCILVVEDDHTLAGAVEARLQSDGYEIILAYDGEEAVEFINKKNIDLALLDVMLPKMNGHGVCAYIRSKKKFEHIPVIMMTALNTMADIDEAFRCGANDYIVKPFSFERLTSKVQKLLEQNK